MIVNRKLFAFVLFLLLNLLWGNFAYAEDKIKEEKKRNEEKKVLVFRDKFERDTPQGSIKGLMDAAKSRDYEKAAEFLDLKYIPHNQNSSELARQLKVVIDQKLWIDIDNVNNTLEGDFDDGLPKDVELLGVIHSDKSAYNIILKRSLVDDIPIWKISAKTVCDIPKMYDLFGYGMLGKVLPPILLEITIFKITAGEWISLFVILIFSLIVSIILTKLIKFILKKFKSERTLLFFNALLWPIRWLLVLIIGKSLFKIVVYSAEAKAIMKVTTVSIIIFVWFFFNLIDYFFDLWSNNKKNKGKRDVIVLYSLFKKGVKLLILFVGATIWLDNLGFSVTTIIAGLGVGGIAIALAAQKSIEDLLGAMTLLSSRPVEIGDFVKFGDKKGTIEDISLRLTKVRTPDRTLVNIPNSIFASLQLENYTSRDKIRFHPTIHLCYETTSDQLRCLLTEIREIISSHPKILKEPLWVRFVKFGTYSLECDIVAYADTKIYSEFLGIAEELNFSIMNAIEAAGAHLAIPAQNIYMQSRDSVDKEKLN